MSLGVASPARPSIGMEDLGPDGGVQPLIVLDARGPQAQAQPHSQHRGLPCLPDRFPSVGALKLSPAQDGLREKSSPCPGLSNLPDMQAPAATMIKFH